MFMLNSNFYVLNKSNNLLSRHYTIVFTYIYRGAGQKPYPWQYIFDEFHYKSCESSL